MKWPNLYKFLKDVVMYVLLLIKNVINILKTTISLKNNNVKDQVWKIQKKTLTNRKCKLFLQWLKQDISA